jgi:GNAT superfamily N-acetyltransferase
MTEEYQILNTEMTDVKTVFKLFDDSVIYQEKNGYPAWKSYDKDAIIKDIENKNQYKVVVDSSIAIVFSVCYADPVIWRTRELAESIYLHRIVVNPVFKGRKLFAVIHDWAIRHAKEKGLKSVRMDTWADNSNIIMYYKSFGFNFIENYTTPDSAALPKHNRNLALALLEYKLDQW